MNKRTCSTLGLAAALAVIAAPMTAHAESSRANGAGPISANARVDFRVVIPRFVSLRVGSPSTTIDMLTFTVPDANLGDGSDIAATGGDVSGSVLTAQVRSNAGDVSLDANSAGALTNGTQSIPWSEILATSSAASLPAPAIDGATETISAPVNGVVVENAEWTFAYSNTNVVAAGTYDGRVTYTATVL